MKYKQTDYKSEQTFNGNVWDVQTGACTLIQTKQGHKSKEITE